MTKICEKLITIVEPQPCLVCYKDTTSVVTCCQAVICKSCYLEWLKYKRQCMHCKADQCEFQKWFDNYRVEEDFDPQEYLHNLLVTDNEEHSGESGFTITDLFSVIQHNINNQTENPYVNMEELIDIPNIDEPFELQYGFTTTPLDQHGNPTGQPGVTVIQNTEIDSHIYDFLQQYQNMFHQLYDDPVDPH